MSRRALAQFLALSGLWGASYLFIKIGLRGMSAAEIVSSRTALAALVLLPVALHRGALRGLVRHAPKVAVLGTIQLVGPLTLITLGERHIASSLAGILVAAAPIWTAVLAPIIDPEEKSSGRRLGGVLIGILGVALLLGVDVSGDSQALLGGVMVVLAALGYALAGFYVKRHLTGVQPVGLVTGAMFWTAIVMLPAAIATAPSHGPGAGPLAAVAALGIAGTGIAFALFYTLIGTIGPARTSLVAYLGPAFALLYGVVFLSEGVSVGTFAGLALILGGSWLAAGGTLAGARGKLSARRVDVAPARESHGGAQPVFLESCAESVDRAAS